MYHSRTMSVKGNQKLEPDIFDRKMGVCINWVYPTKREKLIEPSLLPMIQG